MSALGAIGSNAAPALTLLRESFAQETNWHERCELATALCQIDGGQTEALAFLTNSLLTNSGLASRVASREEIRFHQFLAAGSLGKIGPGAKAAVPALLAAMDLPDDDQLWLTISGALEEIGLPPDTFLPRIRKALRSDNEDTRAFAAGRILDIDPADHDAQLVLMDLVQRATSSENYALEALGRAGPAAGQAVPVLRAAAKNHSDERAAALRALKRIEAKGGAKKAG